MQKTGGLVAPLLASIVLVTTVAPRAVARPDWKRRIDALVRRYDAGVVVADDGRVVYSHRSKGPRAPASNQKLLLSMALFEVFGQRGRIPTAAAVRRIEDGVVAGDLWVLGRGDPSLTSTGTQQRSFDLRPTRIRTLARRIHASGVRRIEGGVMGSTAYFGRDWDARGWQPYVPARFAPLPSALAFNGNSVAGVHIRDPERRVAAALKDDLLAVGVEVAGTAGAGRPPRGLEEVARVGSAPLWRLVRYMNRYSSNFFAEMLGKRLGAEIYGAPGTIAKGARALRRWTRKHGARVEAHDSSGLSYDDRISPAALVRVLAAAEKQPWIGSLRRGLPQPGQGTLAARLEGVRVRAKTGTHFNGDSALSGWVKLRHGRTWVEFSILSVGMPKSIEDAVVRTVARFARPPAIDAHPVDRSPCCLYLKAA